MTDHLQSFFLRQRNKLTSALRGLSQQDVFPVVQLIEGTFAAGRSVFVTGFETCAINAIHFASDLYATAGAIGAAGSSATAIAGEGLAVLCQGSPLTREEILVRRLQSSLHPGDLLVVLSCSGAGASLEATAICAHERGASTLALLGSSGECPAASFSHTLRVSSEDSAVVETAHLLIAHLVCEYLRKSHAGCGFAGRL